MPVYFSAHTTACLTKQALRGLMAALLSAQEITIRRCVASQIGGRMLTEAEAPDQNSLETWFRANHINCEWVMRIDLDGRGGQVTEY